MYWNNQNSNATSPLPQNLPLLPPNSYLINLINFMNFINFTNLINFTNFMNLINFTNLINFINLTNLKLK